VSFNFYDVVPDTWEKSKFVITMESNARVEVEGEVWKCWGIHRDAMNILTFIPKGQYAAFGVTIGSLKWLAKELDRFVLKSCLPRDKSDMVKLIHAYGARHYITGQGICL
jgi:hypothetical protein